MELESRLAMLFGGRIAEELIFGPENVTTGAGNDIQQATEMARRHGHRVRHVATSSGRCATPTTRRRSSSAIRSPSTKNVSDATAQMIDEEVRRLIEEAEAMARADPRREHRDDLDALAKALLEYETLSAATRSAACCAASRSSRRAARRNRGDGGRARLGADQRQDGRPDGPAGLGAEPQPGA